MEGEVAVAVAEAGEYRHAPSPEEKIRVHGRRRVSGSPDAERTRLECARFPAAILLLRDVTAWPTSEHSTCKGRRPCPPLAPFRLETKCSSPAEPTSGQGFLRRPTRNLSPLPLLLASLARSLAARPPFSPPFSFSSRPLPALALLLFRLSSFAQFPSTPISSSPTFPASFADP